MCQYILDALVLSVILLYRCCYKALTIECRAACLHSRGCNSYDSQCLSPCIDAHALLLTTGFYLNWVNSNHSKDRCYHLQVCAGFGWDRVNFLQSSWYGAMVWICAGNSVDNTEMF